LSRRTPASQQHLFLSCRSRRLAQWGVVAPSSECMRDRIRGPPAPSNTPTKPFKKNAHSLGALNVCACAMCAVPGRRRQVGTGIEKRKRMLFLTGRRESSGRGRGHQIKTGNELFCLCVRDEHPAGNAPSDHR
jgi:hypothetical protein